MKEFIENEISVCKVCNLVRRAVVSDILPLQWNRPGSCVAEGGSLRGGDGAEHGGGEGKR